MQKYKSGFFSKKSFWVSKKILFALLQQFFQTLLNPCGQKDFGASTLFFHSGFVLKSDFYRQWAKKNDASITETKQSVH
ncbi:hypothetical protein DRF65_20805 [Chryseobacterium pennae]|uniref:Uncharacterized protein n=1 Tax=Chryseobacterium pennae TaxID=2258962 RepID=A0A3D9C3R8_9FLAO|nr:hypothetical protein DRF65_20805 [Chryseobacterium pennae]